MPQRYFLPFLTFIFLNLFSAAPKAAPGDLVEVDDFGPNPGNLKMYYYLPKGLEKSDPLVVVLHGCTQTAEDVARSTGWNKLADQYQFAVLYPEQVMGNNPGKCFNWFRPQDQSREGGEPASIMSMIRYLEKMRGAEPRRIFITGLSAGGAMTANMLALFPDVFDAGAVFAGGPALGATSFTEGMALMNGKRNPATVQSPFLIREMFPGWEGDYPSLLIVHGLNDEVVSPRCGELLREQWMNLCNTDTLPVQVIDSFAGCPAATMSYFQDERHDIKIATCFLRELGHQIPLDTGNCRIQCGQTGLFATDIGFSSTFFAADFFGIVKLPGGVMGLSEVQPALKDVRYEFFPKWVDEVHWSIFPDAVIRSGQGTRSITVDFGSADHFVLTAVPTGAEGCMLEPVRHEIYNYWR